MSFNWIICCFKSKFFFSIFHNTKTEEVELYLPRIKLENSYNLNNRRTTEDFHKINNDKKAPYIITYNFPKFAFEFTFIDFKTSY